MSRAFARATNCARSVLPRWATRTNRTGAEESNAARDASAARANSFQVGASPNGVNADSNPSTVRPDTARISTRPSQSGSIFGRPTLAPERAIHYQATLEQMLGGRTRLRLEAYSRQDRDMLHARSMIPGF